LQGGGGKGRTWPRAPPTLRRYRQNRHAPGRLRGRKKTESEKKKKEKGHDVDAPATSGGEGADFKSWGTAFPTQYPLLATIKQEENKAGKEKRERAVGQSVCKRKGRGSQKSTEWNVKALRLTKHQAMFELYETERSLQRKSKVRSNHFKGGRGKEGAAGGLL